MIKALYRLKPELNDPRFASLLFDSSSSSLLKNTHRRYDLDPIVLDDGTWKRVSLRRQWEADLAVGGPVRGFNDYPCIDLDIPAFSQKAVNALGKYLTDNGELLPVHHPVGTFYVYNLLTFKNVLRRASSVLTTYSGSETFNIKWYSCFQNRMEGLSIFSIPEDPFVIHVTDLFKKRVEECGLNGFVFIKVWPFEEGVYWEDVYRKEKQKNASKKSVDLAGEVLILRFRLAGPTPSQKEAALVKKYDRELDALLSTETTQSDEYIGQIDVSETVQGEHRFFLSCPSTDRLAEHLKDWVQQTAWPGEFHLVKRYGHLFNKTAKEKRIVIQ